MTQTITVDAPRPLTDADVQKVQAFITAELTTEKPNKIDFDALDKLLEGKRIGGNKSSVELVHEAMDEWADKMDRDAVEVSPGHKLLDATGTRAAIRARRAGFSHGGSTGAPEYFILQSSRAGRGDEPTQTSQ